MTEVIERSIENPKGWYFGGHDPKSTYLRLTVDEEGCTAPGHFGPIHNHINAYAIIEVLCDEILIRIYLESRLNVIQHKPIEQLC